MTGQLKLSQPLFPRNSKRMNAIGRTIILNYSPLFLLQPVTRVGSENYGVLFPDILALSFRVSDSLSTSR